MLHLVDNQNFTVYEMDSLRRLFFVMEKCLATLESIRSAIMKRALLTIIIRKTTLRSYSCNVIDHIQLVNGT